MSLAIPHSKPEKISSELPGDLDSTQTLGISDMSIACLLCPISELRFIMSRLESAVAMRLQTEIYNDSSDMWESVLADPAEDFVH